MGRLAHHRKGQCSRGKAHTLTKPELSWFLEKNLSFLAVDHRVEMFHSSEKAPRESVAKRALNNRSDSQEKGKTL